jgi:hypothetical protein
VSTAIVKVSKLQAAAAAAAVVIVVVVVVVIIVVVGRVVATASKNLIKN